MRADGAITRVLLLAVATALLAAPLSFARPGDSQVYAPVNWQGYGRPVETPARFNVWYEAQSLWMKNVRWTGWGTSLAIGRGVSYYNSNRRGDTVTLYMGGGLVRCDNGKRYYKRLAATGGVTN